MNCKKFRNKNVKFSDNSKEDPKVLIKKKMNLTKRIHVVPSVLRVQVLAICELTVEI
jgi:hypothetical protein